MVWLVVTDEVVVVPRLSIVMFLLRSGLCRQLKGGGAKTRVSHVRPTGDNTNAEVRRNLLRKATLGCLRGPET